MVRIEEWEVGLDPLLPVLLGEEVGEECFEGLLRVFEDVRPPVTSKSSCEVEEVVDLEEEEESGEDTIMVLLVRAVLVILDPDPSPALPSCTSASLFFRRFSGSETSFLAFSTLSASIHAFENLLCIFGLFDSKSSMS